MDILFGRPVVVEKILTDEELEVKPLIVFGDYSSYIWEEKAK